MEAKSAVAPALPSSSRYELLVRIASGGMATVYVGRLSGAVGFWRLVAIKRAHPHLLEDPSFARMLVAEARLASKIHHQNVVAVQDVEELDGELLLIMDYVEGASLSALITLTEQAGRPIPLRVALRIVLDSCAGLHAAHELTDENGDHLGLVHRDVSPHNILVGIDGLARIADFGIAKVSTGSGAGTNSGSLKGKVAYMAPEYVETSQADVRSDVFSLGIVAWEAITRQRLFRGQTDMETLRLVIAADIPVPSRVAPWVSTRIDAVILKALERDPDRRYATVASFGTALEAAARAEALLGTPADVTTFVRALVGPSLEARRTLVRGKLPIDPERAVSEPSESVSSGNTEIRTATLPTSALEGDQLEDIAIPVTEMSTLGTASTSSANVLREERSTRGARVWIAAVGVVALVICAGGALFGISRYRAGESSLPSNATSAPSIAEDVIAMSAEPAHSIDVPAIATTAIASASARPRTGANAPPSPRAQDATKPIAHPPATAPTATGLGKAPPNPYSH